MQRYLARLWTEVDGFVLSSEVVLYGTLGVVGVGAGYAALRDSVNAELTDVAKAIGSIDQSFWYSPVVGHSAWSAGSAFYDRADYCDGPQPAPVVVEPACPPDRPLVCADVFGPQRHARSLSPSVPQTEAALRPGPDSLPGPDARRPVDHAERHLPPPVAVAPHPHHPHVGYGHPSKGVHVGEPAAVMVAGAPGLIPFVAPGPGGVPVNVMVSPWHGGPYGYDVPEGFFNHGPGATWAAAPHYRVLVEGRHGRHDYGYAYAPDKPGMVRPGAGWDAIDLGFAKVGDEELKQVEKFATAKCLHVLGSNVSDKGLAYIGEMEQLESLHLIGTQATDAGLKELTDLKKLRFLHLIGTKMTDAGLPTIARMKQLEELDVRGTPVSEAGLMKLQEALPTLRIIR